MLNPQSAVAERLKELGVDGEIVFNTPPKPEMGDFSSPIALKLAPQRGRPKEAFAVAEELRTALIAAPPAFIRSVQVTRPGFLNFFVDDLAYWEALRHEVEEQRDGFGAGAPQEGKVLVEHTSVNPNKTMHVGHVRNAVLGDTVVRVLRKCGYTVEACNYIDDTGVQVVDVVTALLYLDEPHYAGDGQFDSIWAKASRDDRFDYFCWDLYARVQDYLKPAYTAPGQAGPTDTEKEHAAVMQRRKAEVMHEIEQLGSPIALFAKELAKKIVRTHLHTASRLNVFYNLLNWESDILGAGFWQRTFEHLRSTAAIHYAEDGPNAGCWVVPMGGIIETAEGPRSLDRILVRSNGVATYTAKDIAYQLWKYGRLDTDFRYRFWGAQLNEQPLWSTASDGDTNVGFGHATRVINVIDESQTDPQNAVRASLERLGYAQEAAASAHLDYAVVKLTPKAAAELGVQADEEAASARDVSMSGRRGLGVKADDLIDHMIGVIREKNSDPAFDAESLAAAAIRYYMLRFSTNTIIRFDFEVASQTNGDSGVYLVYSFARACGILRKAAAMGDPSEAVDSAVAGSSDLTAEERQLIREMGRFGEVVQQAAATLATTPLTAYAFGLASAFAGFYDHTPPMLRETDLVVRKRRLEMVSAFRQVMKNILEVLGISALERI